MRSSRTRSSNNKVESSHNQDFKYFLDNSNNKSINNFKIQLTDFKPDKNSYIKTNNFIDKIKA